MKLAAVALVPLVPLLATAAPRLAHADAHVAIGAAAGPNLPTGELGLVVQYAPLPWLAVEAGAGANGRDAEHDGPQTALTLRVRGDLGGPVRVFAGFGGSMGHIDHATTDDVCSIDGHGCADIANGFAWWTHAEVGVELEFEHAFVRMYGGARWLGNRSAVCREPEPSYEPCVGDGFFGIAAGARI